MKVPEPIEMADNVEIFMESKPHAAINFLALQRISLPGAEGWYQEASSPSSCSWRR